MFDQNILIPLMAVFAVGAVVILMLSLRQLKKDNPGGLTPWLLPFGIFVWGDGVVLGIFWILVALAVLWLQDWLLFALIYALFWMIRSLGEVFYWFLQQFSTITRDPPENLWLSKIMPGHSVWYGYQLIWQCVFVISSISFVYLLKIVL